MPSHGHIDGRAPVSHEPDRDESDSPRGGDAINDVTTARDHVPRAEQAAQPLAGDGRTAEASRWRTYWKSKKSRSTSRPRGRLLLGDQLYGARSIELPTTRPGQSTGAPQRPLAIAGIPLVQVPQVPVEDPAPAARPASAASVSMSTPAAGSYLTLA